jgi:hypothetical protein
MLGRDAFPATIQEWVFAAVALVVCSDLACLHALPVQTGYPENQAANGGTGPALWVIREVDKEKNWAWSLPLTFLGFQSYRAFRLKHERVQVLAYFFQKAFVAHLFQCCFWSLISLRSHGQ